MRIIRVLKFIAVLISVLTLGVVLVIASAWKNMGRPPNPAEIQQFSASPQWAQEWFQNHLPQKPVDNQAAAEQMYFGASEYAEPKSPLQIPHTDSAIFESKPQSGLRVTWLGHSSLFIEIENKNILIDPVWGERASPFSYMGVKRFYPMPVDLEDLPKITAVLISHDHYDHLDRLTAEALKGKGIMWYVPLGVGSHLRYWGVDEKNIRELDWWQNAQLDSVQLTAIPSRHSSGRSIFMNDTKKTLWSGWVIKGQSRSLVYSGDTSMHDDFKTVGEKLGPFDLSIIEIGAYNDLWRDNHLGPEQALLAHQLLNAEVMLPVHWGGFNLSTHGWTEPVERLQSAVQRVAPQTLVLTPLPGQPFEIGGEVADKPENINQHWWPDIPWDKVQQKPIWSSRVENLLKNYRNKF